jgi:outer membrane protein insertion porin family
MLAVFSFLVGCSTTKHILPNQYLLKKNTIVLRSEKIVTRKGELKDNLNRMIVQKPNTTLDILPIKLPLKLWKYNRRYNKYRNTPADSLPKSAERPVILDTSLTMRSVVNMKSYLFHQGYFYARVKDTFVIKGKKAYVTYTVNTGDNFLINRTNYFIEDSGIAELVRAAKDVTVFEKGKEYTYGLADEERSRLTAVIRNNGYYRFSQENITFKIDTFDKALFRNAESPFESAINFITTTKSNRKPTLDIDVHIQLAEDTNAFKRYTIGKVTVYPDYVNNTDLGNKNLITKTIDHVDFKYHKYYVHPRVLYEHMYLNPGDVYSLADYDKTYRKLNELGIFQYSRLMVHENRNNATLDYNIILNRAKKLDFSALYDISSGSTYALGHSLGINFRNKNFFKGANLLTVGVNGGFEYFYVNRNNILKDFSTLTTYYGVNASIDFPKFLAPVGASLFSNSNLPHTVIGGGENVIDRLHYFTLINTSANYTYNWRQTLTKSWSLSPAFVNIIQLPHAEDSFKKVLSENAYLRNSYKENFIEGENISFTFDDMAKKRNLNYSYLKLGLEEAGIIPNTINELGGAINKLFDFTFAQYVKFDFDARHFFTLPHSVFAFRLYGGIGLPYGQSTTLPYIKQYFAGGPYSLRGWRIRQLGPGGYHDTSAAANNLNQIDRTGDIKLELNGEYRFPITTLLAGSVKMNGVFFGDAGNIWMAKKETGYPNGEFALNKIYQDLAVDVGAGLRFDILSFITIRIEASMPIKQPYNPLLTGIDKNGWMLQYIDLYNTHWRCTNVVFPLVSIGYPF